MLTDAHDGKLCPPGEGKETPISSHASQDVSATMLDRSGHEVLSTRRGFFRVKFGAGILRDIRARAPWYWSDWTDAWNYRVLPATALVFFAK